ncbi:MAG: MMPL family transporter [Thermoproteota archaeon]|nr:MMPL family transporter [Thermoproteota archaeon]
MERYYTFIKRNYKLLLIFWIIVVIISAFFVNKINEIVVYEVEITLPNSMSKITIDKLLDEFAKKNYSMPFLSVLTGYNFYIILKTDDPFSDKIKEIAFELEQDLKKEIPDGAVVHIYSIIKSILNDIALKYNDQLRTFYNLTLILAKNIFLIKKNITLILNNYFVLNSTLTNILNFLYYLPYIYIKCYNYTIENDISKRLVKAKECVMNRVEIKDPALKLYFEEYYEKVYYLVTKNNSNIIDASDLVIKNISYKYLANAIDPLLLQLILLNTSIRNWQDKKVLENLIFQILAKYLNNSLIQKEILLNYIKKIINNEKDINTATYELTLVYIKEKYPLNNINIDKIVYDLVLLNTNQEDIILDYFVNLVSKEIENIENNVFSFSNNFKEFLKKLIINNNFTLIIEDTINKNNINEYPIKLNQKIINTLVKDDMFIIALILKKQPADHTINKVNEIKNEIQTKYSQKIYLTGIPAISNELKKSSFITIQTVIPLAILIVFILVSLYFRSIITGLLSLLLFVTTITTTYFLVYLIIGVIINHKLSYISPSILTILILGLCSDYFVYMIRRYKIERINGQEKSKAIKEMCIWSSQGVFVSALAVLFSYLTLTMMNIPLFGDAALANTIGIGVTLLTNLLLLPSLLFIIGDKAIWPLKINNRRKNHSFFTKIASFDEKNKGKLTMVLVIVTLLALGYALNIQTVLDIPPLMSNSDVKEATLMVYSKFGNTINPIYILVETNEQILINSTVNPSILEFSYKIVQKIKEVKEVIYVETIVSPFGEIIENINELLKNETFSKNYLPIIDRFIGKSNRSFLILVTIDKQPFSLQAIETLKKIKTKINELNSKYEIYYGGVTQVSQDSKDVTDHAYPIIIFSLSFIIILLLFIQLYSFLIPIRLILTISAGMVWSLALLFIVYNLYLNLPLINAVPLFLIVTMLAVGVDYDIFLVTKIKEEKIKGKTDEEAIKIALEKVGTTIIVLGLILSLTILTLMIPDFPLINQVGFTVGLAVLFDSLIIIPFFVPAIMLIAKKWNWWPSKYKQ